MSEREYAGGQRARDVGPIAFRREPELTPEERARAEQEREELRAADLEALERFEQSPAHQLTKEQRFRLSMSHAERLRAADAKAEEEKQANDAATNAERQERQRANAECAAQLVAAVRAANEQAVPDVVARVQQARVAGKLTENDSPAVLHAMAQAATSALLVGVKNDEIAATIRACCGSLGRGETIETFDRDMVRLAERLERVLAEKASRTAEPIFAAVPAADEVADQIRVAADRTLAPVLGQQQGESPKQKEEATTNVNASGDASKIEASDPHAAAEKADANVHEPKAHEFHLPVGKLEMVAPEDLAEFDLLRGRIGDLHGVRLNNVHEYLKHRRSIFGSDENYRAEAAIADQEFNAHKRLMMSKIDGRGEADKKALYRWVRNAYVRAGITNPVQVMQTGETPALGQAIANVEATEGHISRGGFNPRPEKIAPSYLYELGTLSKHGTGKATDIEASNNPTLSRAQWAHIEAVTGMSFDRSAHRWKTDPAGIWQDINDISAAFAALNHAAELAKLGPGQAELVELHQKWAGGFFTLKQSVVVALQQQGLLWGATFSNQVDLHHFELP